MNQNRIQIRFGLRSLLFAVFIASIVLSYVTSDAKRQERAVRKIFAKVPSASLYYDKDTQAGAGLSDAIGASIVRTLLGRDFVDQIWSLGLYFNQAATDDTIADPLADLPDLRSLQCDGTNIGDRTLRTVGTLAHLENFSAVDTRITDRGLEHLHKLKSARRIDIRGTAVTASAAEKLRLALPNCTIAFGPLPNGMSSPVVPSALPNGG